MGALYAEGRLHVLEIGEHNGSILDTPEALAHAEGEFDSKDRVKAETLVGTTSERIYGQATRRDMLIGGAAR